MPGVAANESPPSRSAILGSFLRGRTRNTSQTHIQLNPDAHTIHRDISPSSPPSPNTFVHRRSRPATAAGTTNTANNISSSAAPSTTSSGLGFSSMLRRRRSAGNVAGNNANHATVSSGGTGSAATGPSGSMTLGFNHRHSLYPTTNTASVQPGSNHHPLPPNPVPSTTTTPAAMSGPAGPGGATAGVGGPAFSGATGASTVSNNNNPNNNNGGQSHRIRLVPHLDTRRSLRFDAIGRDLKEGDPALRIGRFTDRSGLGLAAINSTNSNKLAFRSKVVSRAHAEIWVETGGKFFVRDTKSSSGTFLNHVRLSPANTESKPFQIKDGDILQLGVDYQGGAEDIYKSVKIRVEIGREWQAGANAFNTNALKNLKSLALPGKPGAGLSAAQVKLPAAGKSQLPDCCICLFSVTIRQALFIAPCSHTFHFKCIRPLIEAHHPAFSCPLCRTYADLEEDVEVEIEYEDEEEAGEGDEEENGGHAAGVFGEDEIDHDRSAPEDGADPPPPPVPRRLGQSGADATSIAIEIEPEAGGPASGVAGSGIGLGLSGVGVSPLYATHDPEAQLRLLNSHLNPLQIQSLHPHVDFDAPTPISTSAGPSHALAITNHHMSNGTNNAGNGNSSGLRSGADTEVESEQRSHSRTGGTLTGGFLARLRNGVGSSSGRHRAQGSRATSPLTDEGPEDDLRMVVDGGLDDELGGHGGAMDVDGTLGGAKRKR